MDDFRRRTDESEIEYQYRISAMKECIGTWQDVAGIINNELGWRFTESKYRKDYAAFQKIMDAYCDTVESQEDATKKMAEAAAALRMERHKLNATKMEQQRAERHRARKELFYESTEEAFRRLPDPIPTGTVSETGCCEYVLTISDIHYGATFTSINNQYSREICGHRLWNLLSRLESSIKELGIKRLKILNLGDTVQGLLRMTDLQINDIPVVEAVVEIAKLLAAFLHSVSRLCEVEYYHCIAANHTQIRPLGSKASELAAEDLEKVIVSFIEASLAKNDRVEVYYDFTDDCMDFNVFGFNCVATHGHQFKSKKTPVDVIDGLSNVRGKMYDYVFVGHDHSAKEEIFYEGTHHNREVLTCPGFIGSDPYSDTLLKGCKPAAKLFGFDETYGHISSVMLMVA